MAYYHLTEAYADLHNPRKIEENKMFYDNLRFVDYLSQEDIQEVAESIIWEFMDYGNTFDESCDIMMESLSDDGVEGFLTEARVTFDYNRPHGPYPAYPGPSDYGSSDNRTPRRQERVSRVTGAVKRAATGIGSMVKGAGSVATGAYKTARSAAGSAYRGTKSEVGGVIGKAKAALKGLLRSGAKAAIGAGRNLERSGRAAERTTAVYGPGYGRAGGSTEPISTTTTGGAKRRAIGGALKGIGRAISRATTPDRQRPTSSTPRESGITGLRIGPVASAISRNTAGLKATPGISRPYTGSASSFYNVSAPAGRTNGPRIGPVASAISRNTAGLKATPGISRPYTGSASSFYNVSAPAMPSSSSSPDSPEPTSGRNVAAVMAANARRLAAERGAETRRRNRKPPQLEETIINQLLESLVQFGYSDNYDNAAVILENLSENAILSLLENYVY